MNVKAFDRAHLWHFRAQYLSRRDADTLVALVDTGYDGRHEAAIRILGIDAPELATPAGQAASRWLDETMHRWTLGHGPWPLRVVSLQRERVVSEVISFDRYLSTVYLIDGADQLVDLADLLVDAGHAVRVPA